MGEKMDVSTSKMLGELQNQWAQYAQDFIEFKVTGKNEVQVLTNFTDYFDNGILFNIIENDDNTFTFSDKGYTCWNMQMNGIDLSNKNTTRNKLFNWYLNSFNFSFLNNIIQKEKVKLNDIPQTILDFIQLLLRVSDLSTTNRANTRGIFFDEVKKYFNKDKNEFYFTTNNIALGKTNQHYTFEYNFTPELGVNKLTKLYNTLSKNTMEAIIGIYSDTAVYLKENYRDVSFNVLVNGISDNSRVFADGLEEHNIHVINFQDKACVENSFGKSA